MQIRREKNNPVDYREQLQDKASEDTIKTKRNNLKNFTALPVASMKWTD